MWVTVTNEPAKQKYTMVAHSFTKRMVGKPMCSNCGMLKLNNTFSRWAVDKGCNNDLHPAYKQMKRS